MRELDRLHRMAEFYKKNYPAGTRIQLEQMGPDPRPIPSGTRGTVRIVDDLGTVHCDFDNGRRLGLVPEEDSFRKLTARELAEEAKQNKISELAGKLVDFAKDFDFYDYKDNLQIGATDADVICQMTDLLQDPVKTAALAVQFQDILRDEDLTEDQRKLAAELEEGLACLHDEPKRKFQEILADAESRKTPPGGPGGPGSPGGAGALVPEESAPKKGSQGIGR